LQDTVAVQELRFGDNDTLSAQVATLVEADYLFLMTDVDALYTANPKVSLFYSHHKQQT
jgi:glutamate 5-kinase